MGAWVSEHSAWMSVRASARASERRDDQEQKVKDDDEDVHNVGKGEAEDDNEHGDEDEDNDEDDEEEFNRFVHNLSSYFRWPKTIIRVYRGVLGSIFGLHFLSPSPLPSALTLLD